MTATRKYDTPPKIDVTVGNNGLLEGRSTVQLKRGDRLLDEIESADIAQNGSSTVTLTADDLGEPDPPSVVDFRVETEDDSKLVPIYIYDQLNTVDYDAVNTSDSTDQSGRSGAVISPNRDLYNLTLTVGWGGGKKPNDLVVVAGGIDGEDKKTVSLSNVSEGDAVTIETKLLEDTEYAIVGDNGGTLWTFDHDNGATSFPQTSTPDAAFDLVAGVDAGTQGTGQLAGFIDPIKGI